MYMCYPSAKVPTLHFLSVFQPPLFRCEYNKTCQLLVTLFDRSASSYQDLLQSPTPSSPDLALREGATPPPPPSSRCVCTLTITRAAVSLVFSGQLTWLVYLIGSVIGGRISHLNADDYDSIDGQLVCR